MQRLTAYCQTQRTDDFDTLVAEVIAEAEAITAEAASRELALA